jgi:hypothetical protein
VYYTVLERRVAPHPLNSNLDPREVDNWLFPVRRLAQRRLARDWCRIYGANENIAYAGGPFFREAVSAHLPVFLSRRGGSPLAPFPPLRCAWRSYKNKRPIPIERELEPTAFWRREISEELRRRKAVGARSRACVASVREVAPSRRSRVAHLNPCPKPQALKPEL